MSHQTEATTITEPPPSASEDEMKPPAESKIESESTEKESMSPSNEKKGEAASEDLQKLTKELADLKAPEEKIAKLLDFMESVISQGLAPSFKQFWDARKLALQNFKEESLPFAVRAHLWNRYVEVSKEAYRLKEILDEESAFAVEQIDLAIKALEEDLAKVETLEEVQIPEEAAAKFIEEKKAEYLKLQKELTHLNAFASKINSLRKELIKTEMRIRFKNKFFQRLSQAGDQVFPKRKELIKEVSQKFTGDVDAFMDAHFSSDQFKQPLFVLRDEIKHLQGLAKWLTLNTQAFNKTRMKLSEGWDQLKKVEKEKKKDKLKAKAELKQGATQIEEKVDDLVKRFKDGEVNDNDAMSSVNQLLKEMKQTSLLREDVTRLKGKLFEVRDSIQKKQDEKLREKQEKAQAEQKARQDKLDAAFEALKALPSSTGLTIDEMVSECDRLRADAEALDLNKWEKGDLNRLVRSVSDHVSKIRIDQLPEDSLKARDQLQALLGEANDRRKEARAQLEEHRKASGSSGLDLEQAFKQQELMEEDKARLQKVEEEIQQIEQKIRELEG